MTKTASVLLIVLLCILLFPIGIGLIGGAFGIVFGVFGAVFGAIFGVIGGLIGAIFGLFGWIFESIFDFGWDCDGPFGFHRNNIFTIAALVIIVVLIAKKSGRKS